ncbi:Dpa10p Ecym_8372 [Eremothecium cymbalariae DBVPG|uniref:Uncharacterized protein n=1 Tax=Eremothecium cymbalariae (strain CBS 270.75 / DBVPG 7215 / KCTC 17166 / NRRL Y-17582) TaxID=931890 RepID=G8JXR9_ERECY|nr:Hypothetical protein Ecym_8372 [Eremothecium cymbalariae DBVPG\
MVRVSMKGMGAVHAVARCSVPKAHVKSTTFPTFAGVRWYSSVDWGRWEVFSASSSSSVGSKEQRPTVISSDSDEVETVSEHIRV